MLVLLTLDETIELLESRGLVSGSLSFPLSLLRSAGLDPVDTIERGGSDVLVEAAYDPDSDSEELLSLLSDGAIALLDCCCDLAPGLDWISYSPPLPPSLSRSATLDLMGTGGRDVSGVRYEPEATLGAGVR